jgi:hypothetical protein
MHCIHWHNRIGLQRLLEHGNWKHAFQLWMRPNMGLKVSVNCIQVHPFVTFVLGRMHVGSTLFFAGLQYCYTVRREYVPIDGTQANVGRSHSSIFLIRIN